MADVGLEVEDESCLIASLSSLREEWEGWMELGSTSTVAPEVEVDKRRWWRSREVEGFVRVRN